MKQLLLSIYLLLLTLSAAARSTYRFDEIAALEGLPNNEIHTLYQDSDGYIWIGTSGGLFQFDGYKITPYRSNINTPDLLTSNHINALVEDRDKNIYIATSRGLDILDKRHNAIKNSSDRKLQDVNIAAVVIDHEGRIWVGSERGLFIYDLESDSCEQIMEYGFGSDPVKSLLCDSRGDIWIGTWDRGLLRYSMEYQRFMFYPQLNKQNSAHVILEDSRGRIWVGSFGFGLYLVDSPYDVESVSYRKFTRQNSEGKLPDNFIYKLSESSKEGLLLVGTRSGLSTIPLDDPDDIGMWRRVEQSFDYQALPPKSIDALMTDRQGNIWIGTLGSGVRCVKPEYLAFRSSLVSSESTHPRRSSILSIAVDSDDNIWCGVSNLGVSVDRPDMATLQPLSANDRFITTRAIVEESNSGNMLLATSLGLATMSDQDGVIKYLEGMPTKESQIFSITSDGDGGYYFCDSSNVCYLDRMQSAVIIKSGMKRCNFLLYDSYGDLWVGSETDGIVRLTIDDDTKMVVAEKSYSRHNGLSCCEFVNYIYQDSAANIWVCSNDSGLLLYDRSNDRFVSINEKIDFPTEVISSIIEDSEGVLWMGTNVGIIKYFPAAQIEMSEFRLYNKRNGLSDNIFLPRSIAKDSRGRLYFGTHRGYVYFDPSEVKTPLGSGGVMITDIKLNNRYLREIEPEQRSKISTTAAQYTNQLNIPHWYSNFTIEFAPMSYFNPDNVRYAYRLSGYDSEWHYTNVESRFAHYALLPAGRYTFELRSTNEYGTWGGAVRRLDVVIIPPMWLSWWAYLIYFTIFSLAATYGYIQIKQRVMLRKRLRDIEVERDKNEAVNQAKLRFFTNITHDLFTPITIVAAAVEQQSRRIERDEYEIITTNINRLTRLIQQILEFRKAESGNLRLFVSREDITAVVRKSIDSFRPLMKKRNIEIQFEPQRESQMGYIDIDKIDKILYNLLSNALKYNKSGARVDVSLNYQEDASAVELRVADDGEGMSQRAMDNLFKRFYDGEFRRFDTTGTGIGLSLVNDLVSLHKGRIEVDNRVGEGVCFIITLPIEAQGYSEEESMSEVEIVSADDKCDAQLDDLNSVIVSPESEEPSATVLVVEDNDDLRILIQSILSQRYNVRSANNGVEALRVIGEEEIDIIVSDVMMPEMDGFELCRKVKSTIESSDIPFLLLTARVAEESAVMGYDSGADSYLTKPFSGRLLMSRIDNLLKARASRAERFKSLDVFEPAGLDYTSYDEEFLTSMLGIINENISNVNLDQGYIAEAMGVSKSTLNRKAKSLTGMTAINLVREQRLKSAYKLLTKVGASARISEVAFSVGFNDPKYFSSCFRRRFDLSPSEVPTINE